MGLPKSGTLAEVLCIMVWKKRQSVFVAQTRAQAQASVGGDAAVDAFKDFADLVNRVDVKSRNDRMREQIEDMKNIKEIRFRPLVETERKLNVRRVSRQDAMAQVGAGEVPELKPISRTIPIRKR